mmetsp:Transcript_43605/g.135675  ORF Transcript_43605/g.135675 Transcript_43605/m.135675 type:complete len:263 (+) Transcript_43605:97-885(+)
MARVFDADVLQRETQNRQALLATPGALGGAREALLLQQPTPAVDGFFAGDPGLITVFDFDYDLIIDFNKQLRWAQLLLCPPAWISCLCCTPCFLNQNVEWTARAQHVALTVDGIRYVVDKHPAVCGLSCTDQGKESKTVPYDKITDCDIQEPAGTACCCCIPKVLSQIRVDTASSGARADGGVRQHELVLEGLRFPNEFKQAVWSMKRSELPPASQMPLGATAGQSRLAAAPAQSAMATEILVEIRDELRELNAHLRTKPGA